MLELTMVNGAPQRSQEYLELKKLEYTGTAPSFSPYQNALIMQGDSKGRFILHSGDYGRFYLYDLATNTFSPQPNKSTSILRFGTRFAQEADNGIFTFKWGATGSSSSTQHTYFDGDLGGGNAPSWTNSSTYFQQATAGNRIYYFGGQYNFSVQGTNNMAMWYLDTVSKNLVNDNASTQGMPGLTFNAQTGTTGKGEIFIFGGQVGSSSGNSLSTGIYKYTISNKKWSKIPVDTPFQIVGGMNAPFYDGKFWFLGATTTNLSERNKELWSFNPSTNTWVMEKSYPELETYRTGQLFVYKDKLYYVFPGISQSIGKDIFTINLK